MVSRLMMVAVSLLVMAMQVNVLRTYSTDNFQIRFERSVSKEDIKKLGDMLESTIENYRKHFGGSQDGKTEVYVYGSLLRFHADSRNKVFDDGCFREGKIYLMSPKYLDKTGKLEPTIKRVVARSLMDKIKFCPPWLSECYSLYLGDNLTDFGKPAQVRVSGFADLGEEYSAAEREKELKEVYSSLTVTADFLVSRYGEKKVEEMLTQFQHGATLEEIFESVFAEKITDIESAWLHVLRTAVKE